MTRWDLNGSTGLAKACCACRIQIHVILKSQSSVAARNDKANCLVLAMSTMAVGRVVKDWILSVLGVPIVGVDHAFVFDSGG